MVVGAVFSFWEVTLLYHYLALYNNIQNHHTTLYFNRGVYYPVRSRNIAFSTP